MFRLLKAEEIECRIAQVKENGLSLLLYKDARCDMNILDETVSPYKWKREHSRENRNCTVSIWSDDLNQWVSKEDTGTESFTEKEKGVASDSFKRACFNWGIGRELYTSPFIWVSKEDCNIKPKMKGGKAVTDNYGNTIYTCYDKFYVRKITYDGKSIDGLAIINSRTNKVAYTHMPKEKKEKK